MPRAALDFVDLEREPDYEEVLRRYVAAHQESPDAGLQRALTAPAAPADVAGITVRRSAPTRAEEISRAVAEGRDLTPYLTKPSPDARPPAVERPGSMEAALSAMDQPLPDVSMPLPPEPQPVRTAPVTPRRTVDVHRAAHVDVPNTATTESALTAPKSPPEEPLDVAPLVQPVGDPATRALRAVAQSAQADRGNADLEEALRAAAGRRLVAGLARAGGAMVGRGQGAGYDALDREADRPVEEFQARRALSLEERQRAALEAAAAAARGKEAFGEELARKRLDLDERRLTEETRTHKAMEALKGHKGGGPKALTPTQELQREKFDQSLREKATKDAEGASELADTLDRLEGALKSQDLPGVGRVVGRLAAAGVGSDAGIRMRADLQRLADVILRARSGAAVTPSEAERLAIESGTSSGATEQQVRIATQTAIGIMRRAERNLRAKYPGATWEQLAAEGGWTPGSKSAAGPAVTEERVAPDGRVLQKMSDGSIRVKP